MNESVDSKNIKSKVVSSVAWTSTFKFSGQILTWIITILVIRKLDSGDFGLFAEASICISLLMLLSELGFGTVIIQNKEIDEDIIRQIQAFVMSINVILSVLFFFSAPLIAAYFSEPRLVDILKVLSVVFLLLSLYSVPQALLKRSMNFKIKSIIDLLAACAQSITTLVLAYSGYGVWSLVWGAMVMHLVYAVGFNLSCKRIVLPKFGFRRVSKLLSFGGYLTGGNLIWFYYSKADILIGGHFLESRLVGQFSVAKSLAAIPMEKIYPIVTQVALPAYSRIQSDLPLIKTYFLKSIRLASLFTFPIFAGLIIIAPELVDIVLGDEWKVIIYQIQILCLILPFRALGSLLAPALIGIGLPNVTFRNSLLVAVILSISFLIGVNYGPVGLCWAWFFGYILSFLAIFSKTCSVLSVSFGEAVTAILPSFLFSLLMVLFLFFIDKIFAFDVIPLGWVAINVSAGAIFYALLIYLFKRDYYTEVLNLISRR